MGVSGGGGDVKGEWVGAVKKKKGRYRRQARTKGRLSVMGVSGEGGCERKVWEGAEGAAVTPLAAPTR